MVEPICTISGFSLSVSRNSDTATICCTGGRAHLSSGFNVNYAAHSATLATDEKAKRVRVYIFDEWMDAHGHADLALGLLAIDDDLNTPRGVYPGGLIVVGQLEIPAWVPSTLSTPSERPLRERERTSLLAIIRALSVMAKADGRSATGAVEKQLQELGFDSPKEATIRGVLKEASDLQP
ncbi:MAG: hypothetical protein EPN69_13355 [Rhodanobacter sp.]|nr:MAG: hypothetical protein EPN71_13920 [Rhodanobacter sp.]TAL89922.1 MAG: hypothetical protein EPN69_13355 [Rhodanobacter sp.]TAM41166.1 MAG: hypothetical protein EPN58_07655 [Rhodanobacter sp.]